MPTLKIDLHEGFSDDTVVVRAGEEEHRLTRVRTRLQTGYAGSLEISIPGRAVDVEVVVPSRGTSKSVPVAFDDADTVHLGLSIAADGEVVAQRSREPFRYA